MKISLSAFSENHRVAAIAYSRGKDNRKDEELLMVGQQWWTAKRHKYSNGGQQRDTKTAIVENCSKNPMQFCLEALRVYKGAIWLDIEALQCWLELVIVRQQQIAMLFGGIARQHRITMLVGGTARQQWHATEKQRN